MNGIAPKSTAPSSSLFNPVAFARSLVLPVVALLAAAANAAAADPGLYPAGHALEGLPDPAVAARPYADDPGHPLNRLHSLLFTRSLVPEEIQSGLPEERAKGGASDADYFVRGWYFQKRKGDETDRKTFGGDVRVAPGYELAPEQARELRGLLARLETPEDVAKFPELKQPLPRLMLQWDLLTFWWKLEVAKTPDEKLLVAFAKAIQSLSQPTEVLESLPSGLDGLRIEFTNGDARDRTKPFLPADFPPLAGDPSSRWIELGRKSSTLFQAQHSLRASYVYLAAATRDDSLNLLKLGQNTARDAVIPDQDGVLTALVQTLIGIDSDLEAVVTPVADDVRIRLFQAPAELRADHPSSSRDGSSHWIYLRTRSGSRSDEASDFRFVPETAQALFVEYGSLKHATYAAQCALCHRNTHSGGPTRMGIRSLSAHTKVHLAEPGERTRLAHDEMAPVVERLKARLGLTDSPAAPVSGKRPRRPERTEEQQRQLAQELRLTYSRPPAQWPAPNVDEGVKWKEIGPLPKVEHPAGNPFSEAKAQLGKHLFFDPRLSGSGQIACASCHDPDHAWGDGRMASFGHSRVPLTRNAPTIRNVAFQEAFFWDGRATSLEEQATQVVLNPLEMNAQPADVVATLSEIPEYRKQFETVFGSSQISLDQIAQAIACFERTIVSGRSRFDKFVALDPEVFTDSELRGLDLFRRDARCMNCHHGPAFTDGKFHDLGLSYYGRKLEDLGRYRHTKAAEDVGRFRTPSLRDVSSTRPYMHNGLFELRGVLNMYNAGMATLRRKSDQQDDPLFPTKSPHLKSLGLNEQDLDDLEAFLKTLEEPKLRVWAPDLPGLHGSRLGTKLGEPAAPPAEPAGTDSN